MSRWNMSQGGKAAQTVLARRDHERPILQLVNDTVVTLVTKQSAHVIIESPRGSQYLEEREMSGVRKLIDEGVLHRIFFDRCAIKYVSAQRIATYSADVLVGPGGSRGLVRHVWATLAFHIP